MADMLALLAFSVYPGGDSWLIGGAKCFTSCGWGDGSFASSTRVREGILAQFLRLLDSPRIPQQKWVLFWGAYFVFTDNMADFVADYCEAWRCQPAYDMEIVLFVDNAHRLAVPCSGGWDDKELIKHVQLFYSLVRTRGGLFEFLGAKDSHRIDVVELESAYAVGKRCGSPLALGKHGPYNRQVYYFKNPSQLVGAALRERLVSEQVLTTSGQQTHALNIVRTWDASVASIIVLIPVFGSLVFSIIWAIVATNYFKADAQASTQTAFTIGSYLVTAGALLIALVAFLDGKYDVTEYDNR
ncbi:Nn.00g005930.m01.CDS01 [Neocucurbitaria sp. VM-36]